MVIEETAEEEVIDIITAEETIMTGQLSLPNIPCLRTFCALHGP
jgi:hypothetical protein